MVRLASPAWTDQLAAWGTLGLAVIALFTLAAAVVGAWIAWGQLRDGRTLREEQARAYVMAYMEPNAVINQAVELVIKNFGLTGARDIRLSVVPDLKRAGGQGSPEEVVKLPEAIPFLAPGQEIRTVWDVQALRLASQLPKRYDVAVSYTDFFDKHQTTHSVLDWETLEPLRTLVIKNAHHAALALDGIENLLRDWMRGRSMPKLAAYDGRSLDEIRQAELREFEAAAQAAEAREREQAESQGGESGSCD